MIEFPENLIGAHKMKKSTFLSKSLLALLLIAFTETAFAGVPVAIPEPGIFELLAIGAFGAVLLTLKSRNK